MMRTAPLEAGAPATTLDDLTHFVCRCQVDQDGFPLHLPVIAMCGADCHEPEPGMGGPPCLVCAEVSMKPGCPTCRKGGR